MKSISYFYKDCPKPELAERIKGELEHLCDGLSCAIKAVLKRDLRPRKTNARPPRPNASTKRIVCDRWIMVICNKLCGFAPA